MNGFVFHTARSIVHEPGCASGLASACAERGAKRVLLVTDAGIRSLGLLDETLAAFVGSGCSVDIFSDISADPPEQNVFDALERARSIKADLIVGFGGGSSMDVAKVVALLAHPACTQSLAEVYGVENALGPRLPLIQIPTTAGTGSEVTNVAIITTGETTKMGVSSPILMPDLVLLDPTLTLGLPPAITAATGIDAMVHAIEAYTSKIRKNPYSDTVALKALRLLSENLLTAVDNGNDLAARSANMLGAMMAGQAFANAPVGGVHALAYPVGGHFHVPHGLSNSLVLPHVLGFNARDAAPLYAELADTLLGDQTRGLSTFDKCDRFIHYMEQLIDTVRLPKTLRDVGIGEQHLDLLASEAMLQQRLLINNPRDITEADARAIYSAAL